jgi:hypothetical protein
MKEFIKGFLCWVFLAVFFAVPVAIAAGVVYAVFHFIMKFW